MLDSGVLVGLLDQLVEVIKLSMWMFVNLIERSVNHTRLDILKQCLRRESNSPSLGMVIVDDQCPIEAALVVQCVDILIKLCNLVDDFATFWKFTMAIVNHSRIINS